MAENYLAKWLGRTKAANPEIEELRAELQRLIAERPHLHGPALWLSDLLPQLATSSDHPLPPLSSERAGEKLNEGIPLLRGERLAVPSKEFRRRWLHACDQLQRQQPESNAAQLAQAVRTGKLEPNQLVTAIFSGSDTAVEEPIAGLGLDAGLATTFLRITLFPELVAINRAWTRHCANRTWERGYCPTCGQWPLLGEFRGLEQLRFLRCGWCAAAWKVPRLFCPHCGNCDHERLGFFHREGEQDQLRAATCDECGGYVKMLTTLGAIRPLRLWVADLSTLHLDLALTERSSGPPASSPTE